MITWFLQNFAVFFTGHTLSSMATELIKGKRVDEALSLTNQAVVEALDGLPAHKIHCSVLAEEAVRAAIKDYYDKNGIAYEPEQFCNGDCSCHRRSRLRCGDYENDPSPFHCIT